MPESSQVRGLYEQATRAGVKRRWEEAAYLLERCCRLQGFVSGELNSQWMVAADRAGPVVDLGRKALELGRRAWRTGKWGAALEFLQLALYRPSGDARARLDAERAAREWPLSAARLIAGTGPREQAPRGEALRVGHLLGLIGATHAPTRLVRLLASGASGAGMEARVYTAEWAAGWFHNWSHARQSGPDKLIRDFGAVTVHLADTSGDFIERARKLAERIRRDDLDLLVVHASNTEMIAALTALSRPARRLVNVNHASEMDLPCYDGVVHMFANGLERSAMRAVPSVVIPPASDMDERVADAPVLSGEGIGIPGGVTLSGTFGNLFKVDNPAYLASVRAVLEAHPKHHHLIAGGGDDRGVRRFLAEAGLEGRVHLLGPRTDIPALLKLLDFYLASHPYPGALSEIEAMAAGLPVISVRSAPGSHLNSGAEVVGLSECIVDPGDTGALAALATRYMKDPTWGREVGARLRARFMDQFRPEAVVPRHLDFYRKIIDAPPHAWGAAAF